MSITRHATWLCFTLMALACFFWCTKEPTSPHHLNEQALSNLPDHSLTDLTIQEFSTTGRLIHQLTTPLMQHIPNNNQHTLQTPHIIITEPNQPAWEIKADLATALNEGTQITFQHHVLIHHAAYEKNQAGTISTDEISYFPKRKFATTDADITWSQPGATIQAKGMNAYLNEPRIDLLHHARATYEPTHH